MSRMINQKLNYKLLCNLKRSIYHLQNKFIPSAQLTTNKYLVQNIALASDDLYKQDSWKKYYNKTSQFYQLLQNKIKLGSTTSLEKLLLNRAVNFFSSEKQNQNDEKSDNKNENKNQMDMNFNNFVKYLVITSAIVYTYVLLKSLSNPSIENISMSAFVNELLLKGEVERLIITNNSCRIFLNEGAVFKHEKVVNRTLQVNIEDEDIFRMRIREIERKLGIKPSEEIPISTNEFDQLSFIKSNMLFIALLTILIFSSKKIKAADFKPMQPLSRFTRAKFTMVDPLKPESGRGVRFADVAGCKEAKQEVMEFVDILKRPEKYRKLGAKVPKGALLLGPPGCGKTLLAKAVATEGQVPFLAMNGSEFVEVIGGVGASRVRDLFSAAKSRAPCIIYIDELDAIGRQRDAGAMGGGSGEEEHTLNQLLVEMDGIMSKSGVIVLASTNRADVLDKALLRPGRFDRHIVMELPTQDERRQIFEHHLKAIISEHKPEFYSKRLAALTLGFTGADIANTCNEGALYAARKGQNKVTGGDFEYAIDKVIAGTEKRSQTISAAEKRVVAYHESGHALVGWLLPHADALLKVTIVPRTSNVLGFAQYIPKDQYLYTKEELFDKMCMAMGGRVAESLIFNRVTTGAQNDLEKITKMAYAQVNQFGFSDVIGNLSFVYSEDSTKGFGNRRPYSKYLTNMMDQEVSRLTFDTYKATEKVLTDNMDKLKLLAESLLQKETLTYEEVKDLIGPPPHNKNVIEPLQFENEINSWKDASKMD